jgi:hypothetical protein
MDRRIVDKHDSNGENAMIDIQGELEAPQRPLPIQLVGLIQFRLDS